MHDNHLSADAHPLLKQWFFKSELTRGTTLHCKVLHTSVLPNLLAHTQGTQSPYKVETCIAQTCVTNTVDKQLHSSFWVQSSASSNTQASPACTGKCLHSPNLKLSIPHLKVWIQKHRLRRVNGEIQKLEKGVPLRALPPHIYRVGKWSQTTHKWESGMHRSELAQLNSHVTWVNIVWRVFCRDHGLRHVFKPSRGTTAWF
jgi:hypothetical protein